MVNQAEILEYKGKTIILTATAHVSKESVELVRDTIDEYKPDSICVELDDERYKSMENPDQWKSSNIVDVIKAKKSALLLVNLALSSYQKNMAKNLGTTPGMEMKMGIDCAKERGCDLVMADRNLHTTFMRIWRKLSFWRKCKLIAGIFFGEDDDEEITEEDINKLLEKDGIDAALGVMSEEFPEIGRILIDERNEFLAEKIKNAPGKTVVAVLGAAHIPGVKEEIYKEHNLDEISSVPKPSAVGKVVKWVIPLAILGLLLFAFVTNIETGIRQLSTWVIWNSLFAGLFTALIMGHPLSILTSIVLAPFTSMNPLLACGWFAGLVEATVRKPTVEDFNNVSEDIFHIKRFVKNRLLKALAIVIFANIGSTVGTIVAGTSIIKNLF